MNIDELVIGNKYTVSAIGTSIREQWTIVGITENAKGGIDIEASGSKTPHNRTFSPESFIAEKTVKAKRTPKEKEPDVSKIIVSESVELIGEFDGHEMWREDTAYWPHQEKRGRKRKAQHAN